MLDFGVIHACEWSLKTRQTTSFMDFKECLLRMYIEKIIIELNVEHTPKTALTLVALARDVLLPASVNARSLAIKLFELFTSGE